MTEQRLAYSIPDIVKMDVVPWGRDTLLEHLETGLCPSFTVGKRSFVTSEMLERYIDNLKAQK